MPVVEYKMNLDQETGALIIPRWIIDRGHWPNKADHTYVGWVKPESEREYYVPDSLTELSKSDLVNRVLGMHAVEPITDPDTDEILSDSAVTTLVELSYDNIVAKNS
jgi:hypothetical protein